MTSRIALAALGDVPENGSKAFDANGKSILICRVGAEIFAVENKCSHANSVLEGGRIRRCHIICPVHGVQFDLRTGAPKGELTNIPIRTYPVAIDGDMITVEIGG